MVADDTFDSRFGIMSLAVAADSGWYQVDFRDADEYSFGKNKGCAMANQKCRRSPIFEFCDSVRSRSCSEDLRYISICRNSKFTDPCNIQLNYRSCKYSRRPRVKAFKYGLQSICQNCQVSAKSGVILKKSNGERFSECFKVLCNRSRTRYKVKTHSGREELDFICSEKGQKSSGFKYNFNFFCEDPKKVCKKMTPCENDCYFR